MIAILCLQVYFLVCSQDGSLYVVDVMQRPGELLSENSPEAMTYKRVGANGEVGGAGLRTVRGWLNCTVDPAKIMASAKPLGAGYGFALLVSLSLSSR
jgi:hypothetical protein